MDTAFIVVEDGIGRPVRLMPARITEISPHQRHLSREDIERLQLDMVWLACSGLHIPLRVRPFSWTVDWLGGQAPTLNGSSAQLAALLAVIATHCKRRLRLRGWLKHEQEIWASGALLIRDHPIEPALQPLSGDQIDTVGVREKLRAFLCSSAPLFIIAKEDVCWTTEMAAAQGVQLLSVNELKATLASGIQRSARYIVGVERNELLQLLDAIFENVFPRRLGSWVGNILTTCRIPCGMVASYMLAYSDDFGGALFYYLLGLFTDVADGAAARFFQSTSEFGKRYDRLVDVGFNTIVGIGFTAGSIRVWGSMKEAIVFLSLTLGIVVLTSLLSN